MALSKRVEQLVPVLVAYKRVLLVPLAALLVLLTLVGVGSWTYAVQAQHLSLVQVRHDAGAASAAISAQLSKTFNSLGSIAASVQANPQWSQLQPTVETFVNNILLKQSETGAVLFVDVCPSFVISAVWPNNTLNQARLGLDLLRTTNRDYILTAAATDLPKLLLIPNGATIQKGWDQKVLAMLQWPIYLNDSRPEDQDLLFTQPPTNCSICYNPESKQRIWGMVSAAVDLQAMLYAESVPLSGLPALRAQGISYLVTARSSNGTSKTAASAADIVRVASSGSMRHGLLHVTQAVSILPGTDWTIEVQGKWHRAAFNAVLAVGIIASFAMSLLLFTLLLARHQQQMLLESVVPQQVIQQLQTDPIYHTQQRKLSALHVNNGEDSPADRMMAIIAQLLEGTVPAVQDIVIVRTSILHNWNLYKPMNVMEQIKRGSMDSDVAAALMQQLNPDHNGANNHSMIWAQESMEPSTQDIMESASDADFSALHDALTMLMISTDQPYPLRAAVSRKNSFRGPPRRDPSLRSLCSDAEGSPRSLKPVGMLSSRDISVNHIMPPLVEAAEKVLAAAECAWQFDAFELDVATRGHPLSTLAFFLMHRTGLIRKLRLDPAPLARYLRRIEGGYKSNPYHNRIHAADVLQSMHVILHQGGLVPLYAEGATLLACYLAAVVHDFDHGGFTNDFLINTNHQLALTYNDKSPLENHHTAAAMALLLHPECNFMSSTDPKEVRAIRNIVIELVLATDMKQHFALISHFKTLHSSVTASHRASVDISGASGLSRGISSKLESTKTEVPNAQEGGNASLLISAPIDDVERLLALKVALKCSDLGHTSASLDVHKRWLSCLEEEFFCQGDAELAAGLPISPLFDRKKQGASKSQVGFYEFVVNPLFSSFAAVFHGMRPLMGHVTANYRYWQQQEDAARSLLANAHPFVANKNAGDDAV